MKELQQICSEQAFIYRANDRGVWDNTYSNNIEKFT
jgi:hypothetical protein